MGSPGLRQQQYGWRGGGRLTFLGLLGLKIAVGDDLEGLETLNGNDAHDRLRAGSAMRAGRDGRRNGRTCTQSRKKLRLKPLPDKTYLFVTVIRMELPQYASTGSTGLPEMPADDMAGVGVDERTGLESRSRLRSRFLSSAMERKKALGAWGRSQLRGRCGLRGRGCKGLES